MTTGTSWGTMAIVADSGGNDVPPWPATWVQFYPLQTFSQWFGRFLAVRMVLSPKVDVSNQ